MAFIGRVDGEERLITHVFGNEQEPTYDQVMDDAIGDDPKTLSKSSKSKASKSKASKAVRKGAKCKSAAGAARWPSKKGQRDGRSKICGGDGRGPSSKERKATVNAALRASRRANALKGINQSGGPITDLGLKRMGLQRLASGTIVEL